MKKNYIIRQNQLDELVRTKKNQKLVAKFIMTEINSAKTNFKDVKFQNEAVVDILKKYFKRGNLTKPIAKMLVENGVDNEDLLLVGMKFTDIVL